MLLTPGPTALPDEVREAMSRQIHNPDVEPEFAEFYRALEAKLASVYTTDDDVVILGGEGMLGLEAAVASLVRPGDEVLCLSNGPFGAGFADFVEMYGGEAVVYEESWDRALDVETVKQLVEDHEFRAATMVHCETPTGVLNDLDEILATLQDAGVITVVDAVSSLGGVAVPVDHIDVGLGASQKCFSSPPGLATVSVSDRAWDAVEETDQPSFYASLQPWKENWLEEGWFPYTHLASNLYALDASLDLILDEGLDDVYARHERAAAYTRERGEEMGLSPYPAHAGLYSPTVTAFEVDGSATEIRRRVSDEHDVVLATSLGDLEDDLVRVGHMGYGADVEKVERAMDALEAVLAE